MSSWHLYILKCSDGTLYTGITTNIERRLAEHESGAGAKYTKGRAPLELVYSEECPNRSVASKREIEIKSLSKEQKQEIISLKHLSARVK